MPRAQPFADSSHITFSLLRANTPLPPNTHIKAFVGGIAGLPTNNTTTTFRALLHCHVPNDGQAINDYVLPKDAGTTLCSFKVLFGYSAEQALKIENAFEQVDKAREALSGLIRTKDPLTFDLGGADILSFGMPEKTWTAEVEAFGQRTFALGDGPAQQLLPAVDAPPTWFPTPAPSSPPSSAPIPSPDSSQDIERAEPYHVDSRLRPITTLPVPLPPPAQTKQKTSLPNFSAAGALKRTPSPIKQISSAKRPRHSTGRDSSDIGPDMLTTFPPHNGFVDVRGTPATETTPLAPEARLGSSGGTSLVIKEKSCKISAATRRIQVDARPASDTEPDHDDVFGVHEDTGSEHLGGPRNASAVPDGLLIAGGEVMQDQNTTTDTDVRIGTLSRTDTEGSDAFMFAMGRRQQHAESHRQAMTARQSDQRHDRTRLTRAEDDDAAPRKDPGGPGGGPSTSNASNARSKRLERIRKEQGRLEAEAKATELREREKERAAQESASAFGIPVLLDGITYTPLSKLKHGDKRNLMGVVLEPPNPAKQAASGDWLITVVLVDPTSKGNEHSPEGTPVTMFRAEEAQLPVVYPGMVMALRAAKGQFFKDKVKANMYKPYGGEMNTWAHMKKSGATATSAADVTLSEDELDHMRKLRDWWSAKVRPGAAPSGDQGSQAVTPGGGQTKTKPLSALAAWDFANITVKILLVCQNTRGPRFELYVTDGTVNPRPTRNFRELQNGTPPSSIWTVAVFDPVDELVSQHFREDAYILLRNVRVKAHKQTGELEMNWSERVTEAQLEKGWKPKQVTPVPRDDHRATQINQGSKSTQSEWDKAYSRRINELKKRWAEDPSAFDHMPIPARSAGDEGGEASERHGQTIAPVRLSDEVATHLRTVHLDPVRNRISTLNEVRASTQAPNKWRFHARVKELRPRQSGRKEINYVVWYCTRCDKRFDPPSCQACADTGLDHAELRYWIWAEMEHRGETVSVIIANESAAAFLPPLPPLESLGNPNDKRKLDNRVREANRRVEDILLGAMMDGQRSRPIIDWSVESVEQDVYHAGAWKRMVQHWVMGMRGA